MKLLKETSPKLRQPSKPMTRLDRRTIEGLIRILRRSRALGVSAPQVGISLSAFVFCMSKASGKNCKYVIVLNPKLVSHSNECDDVEESCLSFPGKVAQVKRFRRITVKYTDIEGNHITTTMVGQLSHLVQHEMDHLKGVVLPDRGHLLNIANGVQRFLTSQPQAVMNRSRNLAASMHSPVIDSLHVLLALLDSPDTTAGRLLIRLASDVRALERETRARLAEFNPVSSVAQPMLSPDFLEILNDAAASVNQGHPHSSRLKILLHSMARSKSIAGELLRRFGVMPESKGLKPQPK